MHREILYTETEIAERVTAMAKEIAASPVKPDIAAPILVGAYVFAADLTRALVKEGLSLPTDPLWLRSYVGHQSSKEMKVLVPPSENFRGKNILLIDGVLDGGDTIKTAIKLCKDYGAASVQSAVIIDKCLPTAVAKADFAGFTGVTDFIVGYGMDDSGSDRSLPYIAKCA